MKLASIAALLFLVSTGSHSADPLPEVQRADIEYSTPQTAYDALSKKQGVVFSKDDSGWTVAYDKNEVVIWSFAPASEPSFPIVVKRTVLEESGHLLIKMAVKCGGTKEACDQVVRRYMEINEGIRQRAEKKRAAAQ